MNNVVTSGFPAKPHLVSHGKLSKYVLFPTKRKEMSCRRSLFVVLLASSKVIESNRLPWCSKGLLISSFRVKKRLRKEAKKALEMKNTSERVRWRAGNEY